MSKPEFRQGVLGRLYDIAAQEVSFKMGYVNSVELQRTLGIREPKNINPLLDIASQNRWDYLKDVFDTSGCLTYSYQAERLVDGRDRTLYSYTIGTSFEQGIIGIPDGFKSDISPKRMRKVERDRGMFLSAIAGLTYHLRSDTPDEIQITHSYAIKHRGKSLVCVDSDIFVDEGCDGESVPIPTVESAGNDRRYLFVPELITHERLADDDRVETQLAFQAITLAVSDDNGASVLMRSDLSERVDTLLDMMQQVRPVVL